MPSVLKGSRAEELRRRDEGRLFFKDYRPADAALKAEEKEDQRMVMGYAATWDVDQMGDRINPGAFKRTINSRGPRRPGGPSDIKVMLNHMHVVGLPTEMYEDEKGLYVEGNIVDSFWGNECWSLVKNRVLDKMSIGFKLVRWEYVRDNDEVYRDIYEVKLYEWSIVAFPSNEMASVTGYKSLLGHPALEDYLEEWISKKYGLSAESEEAVRKAGRVLSAANLARVRAAMAALQELLQACQDEEAEEAGKTEQDPLQVLQETTEKIVKNLAGEPDAVVKKRLLEILEPVRALLEAPATQDPPAEVADPGIHSALETMERLRKSFRLSA